METAFTPWASLAGGALIGLAAVILMLTNGRIAGVSGVASRLLPPEGDGEDAGRLAFVAGLIIAPLLWRTAAGPVESTWAAGPATLAVAGLLVGFGSVLGNGCTSGHGICGLSRLSVRSMAAVASFMATAAATVFVMRHLAGG